LLLASHPGQQSVHGVAEPFQRRAEQQTVLVAIAPAPTIDELRLDAVELDRYAAAEHDVDVLERDCGNVGAVQRGQRLDGRRRVPGEADASQIRLQVQPVDVPFACHGRGPVLARTISSVGNTARRCV
jgi:hypothetical protein